jgi:HSP20 family protein
MRSELAKRQTPATKDYFLNRFDRVLDSFFGEDLLGDIFGDGVSQVLEPAKASRWGGQVGQFFTPKIDVKLGKSAVQVKAELPGVEEKDVEVTLEKDQLVIRGEKKLEAEKEKDSHYYFERSYGQFERRIALPRGFDKENITAEFKNGLLSVNIPRSVEALDDVKKIAIGAKTNKTPAGTQKH